jgi:sporulation protein YlmC with PRC-barrel domain
MNTRCLILTIKGIHIMNHTVARKLALCTLGMLLFTGNAPAQQKDTAKDAANVPVVGVVKLGVTIAETDLVAAGYRAKKLIGATVYNDQHDKIGKIEDMIITPDGKLSVAVLEVGGFLGLGAHRIAIPVSQFTQIQPTIVLPGATKQALKGLPEFMYVKS